MLRPAPTVPASLPPLSPALPLPSPFLLTPRGALPQRSLLECCGTPTPTQGPGKAHWGGWEKWRWAPWGPRVGMGALCAMGSCGRASSGWHGPTEAHGRGSVQRSAHNSLGHPRASRLGGLTAIRPCACTPFCTRPQWGLAPVAPSIQGPIPSAPGARRGEFLCRGPEGPTVMVTLGSQP